MCASSWKDDPVTLITCSQWRLRISCEENEDMNAKSSHEDVILSNCNPPWESKEKGERTGTRAMTRHAKRVTNLSDMRICNKQIKE